MRATSSTSSLNTYTNTRHIVPMGPEKSNFPMHVSSTSNTQKENNPFDTHQSNTVLTQDQRKVAKTILEMMKHLSMVSHMTPRGFIDLLLQSSILKTEHSTPDTTVTAPVEDITRHPDFPTSEAMTLNFKLAEDGLENCMYLVIHWGDVDERQSNEECDEECQENYTEKASGGFSYEFKELGKRYDFETTSAGVISFKWIEDGIWLSADGRYAFQPKTSINFINSYKFRKFITALPKDILGTEEEGYHSLPEQVTGKYNAQGLDDVKLNYASNTAQYYGIKVVKTLSIIDGGNMLVGRRANGERYVLVGRDAVLQSALVNRALFSDALINEKLKTFTPEPSAINRMTIMLKAGEFIDLSLDEDATQNETIRFLAAVEISKDIMAKELGVTRENLIIVTQPKFHIDVYIRILKDGSVLVHDDEETQKLVQQRLDSYSHLTEHHQTDLQNKFLELNQLHTHIQEQVKGVLNSNQLTEDELAILKEKFSEMKQLYRETQELLEQIPNSNSILTDDNRQALEQMIRNLRKSYPITDRLIKQVLSDNSHDLTEHDKEDLKQTSSNLKQSGSKINKLVIQILQNNIALIKHRTDLQKTLLDLEKSKQDKTQVTSLLHQQLQEADLQVIKTPGVFKVGDRHVNYINGIMGTSKKGERYYITNTSSIEALNQAFAAWIQEKQPGLNVHFVGLKNNFMPELVKDKGGLDCVTIHHAHPNVPTPPPITSPRGNQHA